MQPLIIPAHAITKLIPHRPPFLLLDGIVEYQPGQGLVGMKAVTMGENFFQGHFPDCPIMPGVLVIEALAQASAAFSALETRRWSAGEPLLEPASASGNVGVLGSVKVKLKAPVFPGTLLKLSIEKVRESGAATFFDVRAYSESTTFAQGSLIVSNVDTSTLLAS